MSAERALKTYITEAEVREKALAWVPEVMRFASRCPGGWRAEIDAKTLRLVSKAKFIPPRTGRLTSS